MAHRASGSNQYRTSHALTQLGEPGWLLEQVARDYIAYAAEVPQPSEDPTGNNILDHLATHKPTIRLDSSDEVVCSTATVCVLTGISIPPAAGT